MKCSNRIILFPLGNVYWRDYSPLWLHYIQAVWKLIWGIYPNVFCSRSNVFRFLQKLFIFWLFPWETDPCWVPPWAIFMQWLMWKQDSLKLQLACLLNAGLFDFQYSETFFKWAWKTDGIFLNTTKSIKSEVQIFDFTVIIFDKIGK